MSYYTGDIIVDVNGDFGTISYTCYYHEYMGGKDNLKYQAFGLINVLDIYIYSQNSKHEIYIADNNNILKINLLEYTDYKNVELTTTFISNNNSGNIDGILNETAKIGNISSLVLSNDNNILYLSDITNNTIRKIYIDEDRIETISGFVPTIYDNIPRSDANTGNSYDTRYTNIIKILLINNLEEFLLVLDSTSSKSRIIIIDLATNYSSTLFEINDVEIYDIEFKDKYIYYLDNNSNGKIKNIEIIDITKYKKENIYDVIFNNIFNITSVPYDTINEEYYNNSRYNYSAINGFITNMSIKTNNEFTYVQFGSNNIGQNARIGISTEPVDNIDLKVQNNIETNDLVVLNKLTATDVNINRIITSIIDSSEINIKLNKDIIPSNNNINFGSQINYYDNLFIKIINISDIIINSIGYDLYIKIKNDETKYGNINLNKLILNDELTENKTRSIIQYNNSNLEFKFYNIGNTIPLDSFTYDVNDKRLLLNNLTVTGEFILSTDFETDNIFCNNINTTDIYASYIDVTEMLLSSNIKCYSNLVVCNDVNILNNLISSNDITINSNLYVNQYSFINNLETNNITTLNVVTSNLIVHDTLYTSNLIVQGNQTIIETNNYQTENLLINNTQADGPSLEITHYNTYNVLDFTINDYRFILDKDCKLNLHDIEINNNVTFTGSINNISSNNLNNILNLDKNIIDKFQDSSNYTENVESIVNNTSNIIKDVDDKLNEFIDQDFFKENPLHPIIKEFDNQGNIIKYTYNDNNNEIFSTYDTSNFYIVLKNDTDDPLKHYQLSVTNNLLTDVMMVAGGGSGKNIDIDYQYDTDIKEISNSNIIGLSVGNDNLYYYKKTHDYNIIYYSALINFVENELQNNIIGNITDFKISKNEKVLLYSIENILYINNINNLTENIIDTIVIDCLFDILKISINSDNTYIYLLLTNNLLKVIKLSDLSNISTIDFDFHYIDMIISNDDNYLYMIYNNKIDIFNLKTNTSSLHKTLSNNILKTIIDKYNENFIIITNDYKLVKYNITTNITTNIETTFNNIIQTESQSEFKNSQFDLTFDNSTIYYLNNNILYSKLIIDDVYPSPGGAGGLLYRKNSTINQGVYDLYVGNGGINNLDGYNTLGFGVTVYGGGGGTLKHNDLPKPGEYKGYIVDNNYIIKNNIYENNIYNSEINNGGNSATNINNGNYSDGKDGYNALFLNNDNEHLDIGKYFSGGSGTYPGLKGKGGGTNCRDINKLIKKDLIADSHSGAGSSGGYNRKASLFPTISTDGVTYINVTTDTKIIDIHDICDLNSKTININFQLPTLVEIIIYNNYNYDVNNNNEVYYKITNKILEGNYNIVVTHDSLSQQYEIIFKNETEIIYKYPYNNYSHSVLPEEHEDLLSNSYNIKIKLNNVKYDDLDNVYQIVGDNEIKYDDVSKGGSGIIIMKYNIYNNPISNLQNEFNNRLKLLEENLLFSRINTYGNENLFLKYFKIYNPENQIFYNDIYIDQSYSGFKIQTRKERLNNTVIEKYKYEVKLHTYILDYYNDLIPNIISKQYIFETDNDFINFKDFIDIENKFLYIEKIELKIYDNVYNFDNNSYYSIINKNNTILTPTINSIMPLYKELIINNNSNNKYQLINITENSEYNILWSSKNTSDDLPLNVFNNSAIYGIWETDTYSEAGILDPIVQGKQITDSTGEKHSGEWILIKFDRKLELKKINIDIGNEGTRLIKIKIFGKNNNNVTDFRDDSAIINTRFNIIGDEDSLDSFEDSLDTNIYNITTNDNTNNYNTYLLLFERIEENIKTLKIKNINFEGIYKTWEI